MTFTRKSRGSQSCRWSREYESRLFGSTRALPRNLSPDFSAGTQAQHRELQTLARPICADQLQLSSSSRSAETANWCVNPLKFKKCCQLLIATSNLMSSQPVTRGIVRPSKVSRKLLRRRGKTRLKSRPSTLISAGRLSEKACNCPLGFDNAGSS
jgi:hypothetical protein